MTLTVLNVLNYNIPLYKFLQTDFQNVPFTPPNFSRNNTRVHTKMSSNLEEIQPRYVFK